MPLTPSELEAIRTHAVCFNPVSRFGPTLRSPSPVRVLAELRGAHFDLVHSQLPPMVLPHSQEDWAIVTTATLDLMTAADYTNRLAYHLDCAKHGKAMLDRYCATEEP